MSDDTTMLRQALSVAAYVLPPALATVAQRELRTAIDSRAVIERDVQMATEILHAHATLTGHGQNVVAGGEQDQMAAAREAITDAGEHVDRLIGMYRERAQARGNELALCDLSALCTVTQVLRTNAPALLAVAVGRLARGESA